MKVPLLSRCFTTIPPIVVDDAGSSTGESIPTMLIGCEVKSTSNVRIRKRNVLFHMRKKIFRLDKDYATAARQALGLDSTQVSEARDDSLSVVSKSPVDIDCKGLHNHMSSTQSLPQTKPSHKQSDVKRTDTASLPPRTSTRRKMSVDSLSSAMDESCSGQSILDELLMEVYKDPYEDFLQKLKSSKKMEGRIEEIEVDVLTQLPAIKTNVSPKHMRSRRNVVHQGARTNVSSRSNACLDVKTDQEGRDDESTKSKTQFLENGKLQFRFVMLGIIIPPSILY